QSTLELRIDGPPVDCVIHRLPDTHVGEVDLRRRKGVLVLLVPGLALRGRVHVRGERENAGRVDGLNVEDVNLRQRVEVRRADVKGDVELTTLKLRERGVG